MDVWQALAGCGFNYQSPSWTQVKSFEPGADNSRAIKMAFVRLVAITLNWPVVVVAM